MRKATLGAPISRGATGPCAVTDPGHVRKHLAREPGDPSFACGGWRRRPCREVQGRTPTMNGAGKSDRPIVPGKPANKDGSCRRRRGYGEPYTGTQAETPDTAKGAPTATPAGSAPTAERVEGREPGQRKSAPAKRAPDTAPAIWRAQCAGADTSSSATG